MLQFVLLTLFALLMTIAVLYLSPAPSKHFNPPILLLNFLPVFLPAVLLYAVFNRLWPALTVLSVFVLTLTLINRFKILVREEPFLPSDIILIREAIHFSDAVKSHVGAGVVVTVIFIAVLTASSAFFPSPGMSGWIRGGAAGGAVALMLLLNGFVYSGERLYNSFPTHGSSSRLTDICESRGFLYSFCYNTHKLKIEKPADYSPSKAARILSAFSEPPFDKKTKPVNVVFVMVEAFSALSDDPFFSFEKDPLANYHNLQTEGYSGRLIVPNYGGGTANTEFDVLTGLYTMYINKSPSSFWYIRKPHPSVVSVFKENGYAASAIHPGYGWFYNRKNVYPHLGFDSFQTISDFQKETTEFKGGLVSDRSAFARLTEELAKNENGSPTLSYMVTIQNHTPYGGKFEAEANTFRPQRPVLSPAETDILSNYFIGIADADRELKMLTDFLNSRAEPYLLVFYGDHLPSLGSAMRLYDTLGYSEGLRKFEVEYLIWQNAASQGVFDLNGAMAGAGLKRGDSISANYLGSLVLELLNMDGGFYKYVNTLRKDVPVLTVHRPEQHEQAVSDFKTVQYYRLTGL